MKVFFAEHGSKADLLGHVARRSGRQRGAGSSGRPIPHEYLEGKGPHPERLPWLILAGKFLDELEEAVDRWAEWAIGVVEGWPDDIGEAEPDLVALTEMAERANRYVERVAARNVRAEAPECESSTTGALNPGARKAGPGGVGPASWRCCFFSLRPRL